MKMLFTADWHIKLGQKNVPKDWQIKRYLMLFDALETLQHSCDIMVVGGDIFDKMPNLNELELYFDFLTRLDVETIIFDGNHEATKRGHSFLHKLRQVTYSINSKATILMDNYRIENIDFIPYTNIKTFNQKDFAGDVLCTHVRGAIPPHVVPEIDLEKLDGWNTVLAGDLHSYSNSQRNILYPGSPLSTTFHRTRIQNGVIIFDTETLEHEWVDLELPQLIRKTVDNEDDIIQTEYDHTIYEITGNMKDLANIDTSNSLLDKKIVDKGTESTLSFKEKSLDQEVREYLIHILKLKEIDIENVMEMYYDYIKEYEVE